MDYHLCLECSGVDLHLDCETEEENFAEAVKQTFTAGIMALLTLIPVHEHPLHLTILTREGEIKFTMVGMSQMAEPADLISALEFATQIALSQFKEQIDANPGPAHGHSVH